MHFCVVSDNPGIAADAASFTLALNKHKGSTWEFCHSIVTRTTQAERSISTARREGRQ